VLLRLFFLLNYYVKRQYLIFLTYNLTLVPLSLKARKGEVSYMFIDTAKVLIKAGDGGDGIVAFHREKYIAAGGPDGGDGGKGGDVIFIVNDNMSTLADFRYKRKYIAQNGKNGSASNCSGKSASDLIIKVPRGTIIKDAQSGRIITDMSTDEPFIIAKGGKGGWGNSHFATPTRQCPRFAKAGIPGESKEITFELKLLADIGLAGFPNVGKSTLLAMVSEARPKIANYHFTTLTPMLGVVRIDMDNSFVIADIPGLIEGAAQGIGLGHEFLRHIDRCRMLVHIVDVSGSEGRDPKEDFKTINAELSEFNDELLKRPMIVVGNKSEIASQEQIDDFKDYVTDLGYEFYAISAATGEGVKELVYKMANTLKSLPPVKIYQPEISLKEDLPAVSKRKFTITKHDNVYIIEGEWLLKIINNVNMDDYESLQYFQRALRSSGIINKLEEMGIIDGDTVSIYDIEFDFVH
jgi:GTPase